MPRRKRHSKRRDSLTQAQVHLLLTKGGAGPRITRLRRAVPDLIVEDERVRQIEKAERRWSAWDEAHGLPWRWQLGRPNAGDVIAAHHRLCGCSEARVRQAEEHVEDILAGGRGHDILGLDREHPDPPGWQEAGRRP